MMMAVTCSECGGAHPVWECPHKSDDAATLQPEHTRQTVSLAPIGQCVFCDHRRNRDAARLERHRAKKAKDHG
jgi:hypothetical protein